MFRDLCVASGGLDLEVLGFQNHAPIHIYVYTMRSESMFMQHVGAGITQLALPSKSG